MVRKHGRENAMFFYLGERLVGPRSEYVVISIM